MTFLERLLNEAVRVFQDHTLLVVILIAVVAFLMIFRRKSLFSVIAILLMAGALFYIVTLIGSGTSTGKKQKETLVDKTGSAMESKPGRYKDVD